MARVGTGIGGASPVAAGSIAGCCRAAAGSVTARAGLCAGFTSRGGADALFSGDFVVIQSR
jgi:hypothetical protein